MRTILIALFCLNVYSLKLEMPKIEALTYKVNSLDIEQTKNYFFEIEFYQPFNKIFVNINLREDGIENFKERDKLAEKIISEIMKLNETVKVPSLSVRVNLYENK